MQALLYTDSGPVYTREIISIVLTDSFLNLDLVSRFKISSVSTKGAQHASQPGVSAWGGVVGGGDMRSGLIRALVYRARGSYHPPCAASENGQETHAATTAAAYRSTCFIY